MPLAANFRTRTGLQLHGHTTKDIRKRILTRQTHHEATRALHHQSGHAKQPQTDRADLGFFQFRSDQRRPPNVRYQHVRERRQQHAKLVRIERMTTRSVREQTELLLLDLVLTVTPMTVVHLVHRLRVARHVRRDVTRVHFARRTVLAA